MKNVFATVKDFFCSLDKIMILLSISCCTIGMLTLYSLYVTGQLTFRALMVQAASIVSGIIIALIISVIDYEFMAKLWKIHMPIAIVLVTLTYFFGVGGLEGSDDKAWLNLGFTTLQPSEILKLSFILTFSLHLSKTKDKINQLRPFLLLCLHGAIPTMLVMLQGDYGTALVFFFMFIFSMFAAGLSIRLISVGLVAMAGMAPLIWKYVLPDYLQMRFLVAWHPEMYIAGTGMHQYKGRIALGSGGLFGRGMFNDSLYRVPVLSSDFIFAHIGQIFGFAGTVITLLLITILCVKILMTAKMSRDNLGLFICVGVFTMFLFQSIINVGMILCIIPVIGITLPLISSGGTSVVASFVAIGMVLSVYRHNRKELMFD